MQRLFFPSRKPACIIKSNIAVILVNLDVLLAKLAIVLRCLPADETLKLKFKKEGGMRLLCSPLAKVSSMDEGNSISVNLAFWDMCEYLYRQLWAVWFESKT